MLPKMLDDLTLKVLGSYDYVITDIVMPKLGLDYTVGGGARLIMRGHAMGVYRASQRGDFD